MPPKHTNIPASEEKNNVAQYSLRSLFRLTVIAALYAGLATSVEWRNDLGWPNQIWALLLIIIVLGLVFATRGAAVVSVFIGFLLINLPYLELWCYLYCDEGLRAEVLWYIVYAGVHGAGLVGGAFAIVKRHHAIGGATITLMAGSMTLNYVLNRRIALSPSLLFLALPPNILAGQ